MLTSVNFVLQFNSFELRSVLLPFIRFYLVEPENGYKEESDENHFVFAKHFDWSENKRSTLENW